MCTLLCLAPLTLHDNNDSHPQHISITFLFILKFGHTKICLSIHLLMDI